MTRIRIRIRIRRRRRTRQDEDMDEDVSQTDVETMKKHVKMKSRAKKYNFTRSDKIIQDLS